MYPIAIGFFVSIVMNEFYFYYRIKKDKKFDDYINKNLI